MTKEEAFRQILASRNLPTTDAYVEVLAIAGALERRMLLTKLERVLQGCEPETIAHVLALMGQTQ